MKKILLISDVDNWGGAERARYMMKYLADEFEFDFMAGEKFSEWEEFSDTNFIRTGAIQSIINDNAEMYTKQWVPIPEMIRYKEKSMKYKRDYDLYYFMFHTMLCSQQAKRIAYSGGKILSAITGYPCVKDVFQNEKHSGGAAGAFFHLINDMSVGVVVNNMKAFRELEMTYDGPAWYTPRGIDPEIFYPQGYSKWTQNTEHDPAGLRRFTCVFVGKDRSGKGLHNIIGPACSESQTTLLTNERNYTNALNKDQMREFYNKAHVYCVASETDGTPNPALEAAACGRPIIANPIGNMPEFIIDGYNGFLVDKTHAAYKEKLIWLKEHPEKAKEMGQNARKTVMESWTWEKNLEYERTALREIFNENPV